ncbi:MAG TPA: hypothetical protein VLR88_03210, partial [Propionibacteriaceae bacterium]|nr:hypothetical protein [Propionibacteriaceae bacterium]
MIIHLDHTLETASDDRRHPAEVTVSGVRGRAGLERHRRWERTLAVVVAASLIVSVAWWASLHLTTRPAPPPPSSSPSAQRDPNPATLPLHPDGRFIDPGPFDDAVIFARCAVDVEGMRYPAGGVVSDGDDRPCYLGYDKAPLQVMPAWPMDESTITEVCSATAGYDLSGFTLIGRESSEVGGVSEVAVFASTNDFVALCRLVEAQEPNRVSIISRWWFAAPSWSQFLRPVLIEDDGLRYLQMQGAAAVGESEGVDPRHTRMTLHLSDGSAPIAL